MSGSMADHCKCVLCSKSLPQANERYRQWSRNGGVGRTHNGEKIIVDQNKQNDCLVMSANSSSLCIFS